MFVDTNTIESPALSLYTCTGYVTKLLYLYDIVQVTTVLYNFLLTMLLTLAEMARLFRVNSSLL